MIYWFRLLKILGLLSPILQVDPPTLVLQLDSPQLEEGACPLVPTHPPPGGVEKTDETPSGCLTVHSITNFDIYFNTDTNIHTLIDNCVVKVFKENFLNMLMVKFDIVFFCTRDFFTVIFFLNFVDFYFLSGRTDLLK